MTKPENKEIQNLNKVILNASFKNGLILAIFALVSTGLIAIVHSITKTRIEQEIEAAMARRLNQIVKKDEYDNDVYHDCKSITADPLLGLTTRTNVYRMRKQDENIAVFISSIAPDGYSGKIKLVIGIYENGEVAGVRVTEHQETPGLGDKIEIEKSNWIDQFKGTSLAKLEQSQWQVKKDGGDFDALTGATITPRAIVRAVYSTLKYYEKSKHELYHQDSSCGEKQ